MRALVETSVRRRVTVSMVTIAVLLFGAVSFSRLKINLLPELSYPTLTVRTEYEGAAPAEIENLISKPIEEAVGIVKNVQKVSSISRPGQSDVVLEFAWGTDMDYAVMEVREKMDSIELPLEVRRPVILRFDPSLDPIMRFGLFRESAGKGVAAFDEERLKALRRLADEDIKKELEAALGVAAVKVSGGLEDEIQVAVDQNILAQLDIPIETVATLLRAENVNLSGGRLEEGTHQLLIRTLNQFQTVREIGDVIVATRAGSPVHLRDVATVRAGFKERKAIARIAGAEAVEVAIYKEGDANTVAVAREVERRVERVNEILPKGVRLEKVYDQSVFIRQAVGEVINAAVFGGILAILVLYFFLRNVWATVIISVSIPVSVIATFNLMYSTDLTLNIMSLGGIALGIGMLVDNSIVVLDNIFRHRQQGGELRAAVAEGTSEVSVAVTASTLTTVAVFFPLVFVQGVAGQLFRDQALTITFSLIASLLVALTLIPMLACFELRGRDLPTAERSEPKTAWGGRLRAVRVFLTSTVPLGILWGVRKASALLGLVLGTLLHYPLEGFTRGYARVEDAYPRLIGWALGHRARVLGIAGSLFAVSLALIPVLGVELIPQLSQGELRVEMRMPPGTPLERTDEVMAAVQKHADAVAGVKTTFAVAGSGNRFDANPEQGGENWGELAVSMQRGARLADEERAMDAIRAGMADVPGLQHKAYRPTLFTFKTPVEVEIAGFDLDDLGKVSAEVVRRMRENDRFSDVKATLEAGHPEIQIRFDREKAAGLGLNVYDIANRVVRKVRGEVATRYSWHDRKVDVLVRARPEDRASVKDIARLIVNPESQRQVPLDAVAEITVGTGPSEIRRIDQERVALVTANLAYGDLGAAAADLGRMLGQVQMPEGLSGSVSGQNEEMQVSFRSLRFALLLAVFLVYLVMASQFESFLHPFVILFTIPLALIGVVLALFATGNTISVVVLLGVILLAGIVVNNAIVLIDFINQMRTRGVAKREAITESGRSRLRPILMTTLTTVLGLIPLALGIGEGAEVRAPMAITVIGGLSMSTLLTLVVIPVVYDLVDRRP
ncbi:MAG: efflux RND transporter permease subunit [Thermoanaerobaculaceae bacterium]